MRLLAVTHSLDPVLGGGAGERTFQMARHLAASGIGCDVLSGDRELSRERISGLAPAQAVAVGSWGRRFPVPRISRRHLDRLVADADVVHLMGHWTILNAMTYRAAVRLGRPYLHCPAGSISIFGRSQVLKRVYQRLVGRRIAVGASRCVAIARTEIPDLLECGVAAEKIVIVPNGVDTPTAVPSAIVGLRTRFGLGPERIVLFVGRLEHNKGADLLLDGFARLPEAFSNWQLVFVGPDWGAEGSLQRSVADGRLANRVRFLGYLGGNEKAAAYLASDLVVVPSRREAMSIVALEAGLHGRPVLVSRACGLDEVDEVGGGMVVDPEPGAVASALQVLLGSAARLPEMGQRWRNCVTERFSWERIGAQYAELLKAVVSRREGSSLGAN
ncbi:MAG: glycosyltransferase [Thermoanaerobaculales bacterium]